MKSNFRKPSVFILVNIFLACQAVSCVDQANPSNGDEVQTDLFGSQQPVAWLDAPLDASHLPLAPYQIVFHITDPNAATEGELVINGQAIAVIKNSDLNSKLGTLQHEWEPASAGIYTIQVRAINNKGSWSEPDTATVYVGDLITPSPSSTPPEEPEDAIRAVSAEPKTVNVGTCTPNEVVISAKAIDPDGITVVVIFYRFRSPDGGTTEWNSESMNPQDGDEYEKTIQLTSAAEALGFKSANGVLEYQIIIQDITNNMTRGEVRRDITVNTCPGFRLPLTNLDLPRFILTVTPTPIIIK